MIIPAIYLYYFIRTRSGGYMDYNLSWQHKSFVSISRSGIVASRSWSVDSAMCGSWARGNAISNITHSF